LSFFNMFH